MDAKFLSGAVMLVMATMHLTHSQEQKATATPVATAAPAVAAPSPAPAKPSATPVAAPASTPASTTPATAAPAVPSPAPAASVAPAAQAAPPTAQTKPATAPTASVSTPAQSAPAPQPAAQPAPAQTKAAPQPTPSAPTEKKAAPKTQKPKEEEKQPQSDAQYAEGIDIPEEEDSGNWYEKRRVWKKARTKYDDIRGLVGQAEKMSNDLLAKKKEFEKAIDSFYEQQGFGEVEVTQLINSIIEQLDAEQKTEPEKMTQDQLKALQEARDEKRGKLQTLNTDFEVVKKIDENVSDAILTTMIDQLTEVRSYEEKALENYYKISETLDDQKARMLLNEMDNYSDNIQAIISWMTGQLVPYMETSTQQLRDIVGKMQAIIDELKAKGITLKQQIAQTDHEKLEHAKLELERKARELQEQQAKSQSFVSKIFNAIAEFFKRLIATIASLFGKS